MSRAAIVLAALRRGDWLTQDRARAYCWMIAAVTTIQAAHLVVLTLCAVAADPHGRAPVSDFDAFWSAAVLAVQGHPASAYDPAVLSAAEAVGAQPVDGQFLPYMNPPVFLLLCLPLGLLPYVAAMGAFVAATYGGLAVCIRRMLPPAWPWLPAAAFPAAMVNGFEGQNGAVGAMAFAGGLLFMERRPVVAGLSLGVLSFKPHLALGVPVALCAARRWRVLAGFAGSVLLLTGSSLALLGATTWARFFGAVPVMRHVLEHGDSWPKMQSPFAAVRVLHGGLPLAYAVQALAALLALTALARLARRRAAAGAETAAMVAASLLCTPYLFDYDLACLAVPMAWLAARGSLGGWRPWEKSLLAILYFYPIEARNMSLHLGLPATPFLVAALLALILTRSRSDTARGGRAPAVSSDCLNLSCSVSTLAVPV